MSEYYEKEQIDMLVEYLMESGAQFIEEAIAFEEPAYKFQMPAFFQKNEEIDQFNILLFFMGAHDMTGDDVLIAADNVPGCCAFGKNKREAILNFFRSLFECEDYRYTNELNYTDEIEIRANTYGLPEDDITYTELIEDLCGNGWEIGLKAHYNTIVVPRNQNGISVTLTIPNLKIIPSDIHLWINRWRHGFF